MLCGSGAVSCSSSLLIRRHQRARCQAEIPLTAPSEIVEPPLEILVHLVRTARPALKEFREVHSHMPTSIPSSEVRLPSIKVRFLALALDALVRLTLQWQVDLIF